MYEFKDGDKILVGDIKEYKKLGAMLHEQGYVWGSEHSTLSLPLCPGDIIQAFDVNGVLIYVHKNNNRKYIEWSAVDIILFEKISGEKRFTASEVIRIHHATNEMCCRFVCDECPINEHDEESCNEWQEKYPEETMAAIQEYMKQKKSDDMEAAMELCEEHGYTAAVEVLKKNVVN